MGAFGEDIYGLYESGVMSRFGPQKRGKRDTFTQDGHRDPSLYRVFRVVDSG
jgi:hypothetical protein